MAKKKKSVKKSNFERNIILWILVVVLLFAFAYYAGGYERVDDTGGLNQVSGFVEFAEFLGSGFAGFVEDVGGDPNCNNNLICDPGEDAVSCPGDCVIVGPCNNDGTCDPGEDAATCPGDCMDDGNDGCTNEECRNADPNLPYCENDVCVACVDEANKDGCSSPPYTVCDTTTNTCVECNDGNDCGGLLCDTSRVVNACVECITDDDCDSNNCRQDSTCEPIGSGGACDTFGEDCPTEGEVCDGEFCVLVNCADNTGFCQFDQDCQCRDGEESATCVGGGRFTSGTCSWAGA